MSRKGYGPTLAGSGYCNDYSDESVCKADGKCTWRKTSKLGTPAACIVRRATKIMGKGSPAQKAAASTNPWIQHVARFRESNPHLSYKEALQEAGRTYTKKQKGGYGYWY